MKKRNKRSTRVDAGRKQHRKNWKDLYTQSLLERASLRMALQIAQGELQVLRRRCNEEHIQIITPWPTPFFAAAPKTRAPGTIVPFEYVTDRLGLPDQAGWWWRKPWAWIMRRF